MSTPSRAEIESTLASLVSSGAAPELGRPDVAALLWIASPLRLIWASSAAADIPAALIVDGAGAVASSLPASERLTALAGGLAPRDRTRLEKLRFESSAFAPLSTCACRLVALPDGTQALLTIFVDRLPRLRVQPRPSPLRDTARDVAQEPAAPTAAEIASGPAPDVAPAPSPQSASLDASAAVPAPPSTIRFLWEAGADGRVTRVTEGLADAVGPVAADIVGRSFAELLRERVHDPKDIVAELIARGETFSGRSLHWRIGDSDEAVPVDLAGLPVRDRDRGVVGYRGFGLCRPQHRLPWTAPTPEPVSDGGADDRPALADAGSPDPLAPIAPYEDLAPSEELASAHEPENVAEAADDAVVSEDDSPEAPPQEPGAPAPSVFGSLSTEVEAAFDATQAAPASLDPSLPQHAIPAGDDIGKIADRADGAAPAAPGKSALTDAERKAFREIAQALGARLPRDADADRAEGVPPSPETAGPRDADIGADPEADSVAEWFEDSRRDSVDGPVATAGDADEASGGGLARVVLRPANDLAPDSRAVLDRLPAGVVVHRGERAIFANRYLLDLLGYPDLDAFQRDGGLARLLRGRPGALEGAVEDSTAPLSIATREGETIAIEIRLTNVEWSGSPASMLMLRKMTEADPAQRLRAMELDLRAREESLREQAAILDTATDGVVLLDQGGRILSLNRAAEALFGYDQREVAGEPFTLLLQTESHVAALGYLDAMRGEGFGALLNDGRDVLGRERQGGAIPLFMTLGVVGEGPERKFCAVLRDMTAFKQAEGELIAARRAAERSSAQKSDFLATISHEIRTPLNAIIGFAEVMLEERFGPVGNERYRDYVADIHASGVHVISLVNDLLDLAKIEAGRMELMFAPVKLNELVASCVALLQPQAARDRIVLRTSFAENVPPVEADERALRQIVLNLLSNAVKFTEAGGQVIVSTALSGAGEVVFRVRDTGIGMNEAEIETALEPFRQLATSRKGGGTGLGLPLTKALVEANRGYMKITSRRDEGTLVEVALPKTSISVR
ncbi:MAG: ATP-binding protein [Microvirga sp.]|nr:ATP-binding protein [Microvirga sp.]